MQIELSCAPYADTEFEVPFCFMLKTFRNDFLAVERLVASFIRFNRDNIRLYIICPQDDILSFSCKYANQEMKNVFFISEETFSKHLVAAPLLLHGSTEPTRIGYVNQMLIKLCFWESRLAKNYLCLDSDGEFIRDFYVKDFMFNSDIPYSTLIEDNELKVDPYYYYQCGWECREKSIRKIKKDINFETHVMLTAHGFITICAQVMSDLYSSFMKPRKLTYANLLELGTYEFSWYNMWLQKSQIIPLHIREPVFLYFHHEIQLKRYKAQGITLSDLSRGYVGIVVNSNFQPNRGESGPLDYAGYTKYLSLEPTLLELLRYVLMLITLQVSKVYRRLSSVAMPLVPRKSKNFVKQLIGKMR